MSLALASLVLAISEGSTWGWTDGRILGAFAVALVAGAVFVHRTLHHDDPVIDPTLFHSRPFVIANTATIVYAAGFFAMLLGNILFLTGVWNYSIMKAGLAVTPGPVVVAIIAGPAGKLAARIGFRPVLLFGATCFAAGLATYIALVTATPNYLTTWLPGTLLVGVGVGFTFPVLSAGAVSSLPPARFAVGSAVNQTARQIGGALGIADARRAHRIATPTRRSARRVPPAVGLRRHHRSGLRRHRIVHPPADVPPADRPRPAGRRAARRRGRRTPARRRRRLIRTGNRELHR